MQIDPKIAFWLGVWTSILMIVAQGTLKFAGIPADDVTIIESWAFNLATLNTMVLAALSGYSSSSKGPLVSAPSVPPAVKAVIGLLAILLGSSVLRFLATMAAVMLLVIFVVALGVPANAAAMGSVPDRQAFKTATSSKHVKVAASTAPAAATKAASAQKTPAAAPAMVDPLTFLRQFSVTDLQNALKDANGQTPPNTTSAPCWTFLLTFVQASPSSSLTPEVLGLASAIQKALDDQALLASWFTQGGMFDQINLACAPLINKINIQIGAVGTIAAVAIAGGPAGSAALLAGLKTLLGGAILAPALSALIPKL